MTQRRIIFMGTPAFGIGALEALADAGHEIAAVYSQPPRPAHRGKKVQPSPVHKFAASNGWTVETPLNFKDEDAIARFRSFEADVAVVVAYGLLLPEAILNAPRFGCLNIHASLLPRWRGAAPIQRALEAGDAQTGVTIMQMDRGLDTGPMLSVHPVAIGAEDTAGSLHDTLADTGADAIVKAVAKLPFTGRPQPDEGMTYAAKILKAEAAIDWSEAAEVIDRKIRAFNPVPGAFTILNGKRLKVLQATPLPGTGETGSVLDDQLTIACGEGALKLTSVQPAGKPAMAAGDFLRGHPVAPGTKPGD